MSSFLLIFSLKSDQAGAMTTSLTAEQMARIARNKAEADRRRALSLAKSKAQMQSVVQNSSSNYPNAFSFNKENPSASSAPKDISKIDAFQGAVNQRRPPTLFHSSNTPSSSSENAGKDNFHQKLVEIVFERDPFSSSAGQPAGRINSTNNSVPLGGVVLNHVDPTICMPHKKQIDVTYSVVDSRRFAVAFTPFDQLLPSVLKQIPSKSYNPDTRQWTFSMDDYDAVETKLLSLRNALSITLQKLPDNVVKILRNASHGRNEVTEQKLNGFVDQTILDALFPYQRKGVWILRFSFGISRRGRLLIADEMGLGKTIQALGIMRYFKADWPLLIVCPSSVKSVWMSQIERFLPSVTNIRVIEKGSDKLPSERSHKTVVIMSYDLMVNMQRSLQEFAFTAVIFDESHLIKDAQAQRTKAAFNISRKACRVILLSGTPALSRPVELYSQIRVIDQKIFPNFRDFAIRYCDGKQGVYGFEAKGCSNSSELAWILSNTIMLRRLKQDVARDLPEKRREVVYLNDVAVNENMSKLRSAKNAYNGAKDKDSKHQCLVEYYYETGIAKAKTVSDYIINTYFCNDSCDRKVLIFAHHQVVLDTISMNVTKKGLKSIRIDGTTSSKSREEQCRLFQEDDNVVVAVLSMTAAGVGITLTAATVVVFAELHWNPGTLNQAEDRAHRVGQKDSVFIQYLLAKNTADDVMWPLIQKKLDVLSSCDLSSDSYKDVGKVEKKVGNENKGGISEYFTQAKRSKPNEDEDQQKYGDAETPIEYGCIVAQESISTPVNEPIMEENEIEVVMQKPPAELGSSQNPIVLGLALSAANNTAITANNDNNNNNNNNDASTSTTAASPTFEVLASLNRDLLEAVSCAICTDIMHRCVVINPCGHKFCAGCLSEWMQASKTCPICRGVVLSTIRDNSMDVIIKLLLDANPERRRPVEELQRLDAHDSGSSQLNDWICRTLLADLMNVHGALSSNSRGSSFRRRRVIRRA
ncbi:unnamed protein product [Anisakis simplex]|uniref:Putative SMARCAL1-like protein (inferred by orthology to a C. elegans protein) n=1 Tax=Anisakis simplex TaxID=6269 RepID=A0A0M3JRN8_ANISI|nr:unnamed protein product [Anisakis simplex]